MSDYTTGFEVAATPADVFAAINNVRGWWSGDVEGVTDRLAGEFTYRHRDLHFSRQRIVELQPDARVVWQVLDCKLTFVEKQQEWLDTRVVFELSPKGDGTELRFAHIGLTPACECYRACSGGWAYFIDGSLRRFIETGEGAAPLA